MFAQPICRIALTQWDVPIEQENLLRDISSETELDKLALLHETDPQVKNIPAVLLNMAWQIFLDAPANYREWEKEAITRFLDINN